MPEYRKYVKKPPVIEAVQWFRNGDHPADMSEPIDRPGDTPILSEGNVVRFFSWFHIPGDRFCSECGNQMRKHGIIDGLNGEEELVHPGDYIITNAHGRFYRLSAKEFEGMYEPLEDAEPAEQSTA
jgi:hypothetical protein